MSQSKQRLDLLLLERGLVKSRARGQAMIMAGEVLVDGKPAPKPGMMVPVVSRIELAAKMPYVSRGGYKLAAALESFSIEATGRICADVGACTGGFTDVLLQRGAARVYAIDVGYGQLDWRLRQDNRVVVMERTNARHVSSLPEQVSLVSVDVSFISLKLILPAVRQWMKDEGDIITLIKPQFEAGRKSVGKGGVIRDPDVHRTVLREILTWAQDHELEPTGLIRSPIDGASGNIEFLAWLRPGIVSTLDIEGSVQLATS